MQQIWLCDKRPWLFLFSLILMVGCFFAHVDWQSILDEEKQREVAVKELGYGSLCEAREALRQIFVEALEHADSNPLDLDHGVEAQARIEYLGQAARWPEYRLRVCDIYRHYQWANVGGDPNWTASLSVEMRDKNSAFMKAWHEAEVRHRQTVKFKSIDHEVKPLTLADLWSLVWWLASWYLWLMLPAMLSVLVLSLHDNAWRFWPRPTKIMFLATGLWPLGLAYVYGESRSVKLLREAEREHRGLKGEKLSYAELRGLWRERISSRVPYWAVPVIALVWVLGHLNFSPVSVVPHEVLVPQMVSSGANESPSIDQLEKDWAVIPVFVENGPEFSLVAMVWTALVVLPVSYLLGQTLKRGPPKTARVNRPQCLFRILAVETERI